KEKEKTINKRVLLVVNCRYEGWRGFYKGLSANLTRVTPATVITFVVYENVSHYLRERTMDQERALPILIKNIEENT
ncbi:Mitochondrial folate transporter/carrier, partial [Melipona quadrifasciata]